MKKLFGRKSKKDQTKPPQDLMETVLKLQQQLEYLGQKIDILISKNQQAQRFDRSGRGERRGDRKRRGGGFREKVFTKVICADCGKECEVPFKPSADRPVYCKDCFSTRNNRGGSFEQKPNRELRQAEFSHEPQMDNFGEKKKRFRKSKGTR